MAFLFTDTRNYKDGTIKSMNKRAKYGAIFAFGIGLVVLGFVNATNAEATTKERSLSSLSETIATIKLPKIEQPTWLKKQIAAEAAAAKAAGAARASGSGITVTYDTTTRGTIYANFAEFRTLANQTLNDSRGWARMNVTFKEVTSGGQFTLVLAEANQLPTFSSGCSAQWSCNAGRYVVINQDRWQAATSSWNNAGGSLRDYRHMVINHETGHWLGHGHSTCSGAGNPAAVMQQQSIDLQGCTFNPWPLASELNSSTLGIY